MTLSQWLLAGAAVVLAFVIGYKLGHYRGRRMLGVRLRQAGSVFADKL